MEEHRRSSTFPCLPSCFQKCVGTHHIGRDKALRIDNRAVHMALRGKVHHRIDVVVRKKLLNERRIANVTVDEHVAVFILRSDIRKVLRVARIGERIEINHPPRKPHLGKKIENEIRPNKPRSAGDKDVRETPRLAHCFLQGSGFTG